MVWVNLDFRTVPLYVTVVTLFCEGVGWLIYARYDTGSTSSWIVVISTEAESDPDINDMTFVHYISRIIS